MFFNSKKNDGLKDSARVKELEQLLSVIERGKQMWQSTFDAIRDPVVIINDNFDIERANLSTAHVCNNEIRDLIGKKCYKIFAGRKTVCDGCPLIDSLESNKPSISNLNNQIHRRDYEVSAYPYPGGEAKSSAAVLHYRDITEEKRLQQEVIQQEKMAAIGMLAGGVAHEINNPLGGILAFTQLMLRDVEDNDSVKCDLQEIERAALRCKKIVADLLDFSRVSSEKEKRLIDVNVLIEKLVPFIKVELKSMNVDLHLDLDSSIPKVYGNASKLQQVFLNLMTNACHSMEKGGDLGIRTYSRKKYVCVEVDDKGCGISKENISKIFDPFFTTKDPGKGTGLGLSVSYQIVREHEGIIEVESEKGRGSKFTACFPLAKAGG